jgi:leucyl-tRNA synthetase
LHIICPQVLYDLGVVSTKEPFGRLVSQGMILGEVEYSYCIDAEGRTCSEDKHDAVTVRVSTTLEYPWLLYYT